MNPKDNQALAEQAVKLGYVKTPQEYLAAETRGTQTAQKMSVPTIDASKVGTTKPLDIPNQKNTSKTDKAMASITTTPPVDNTEPQKLSFGDLVSQSVSGIKDQNQKDMVMQLLNAADSVTGGQYSQAGEDILSKLLDTQINQSKRKKESARLQEQAGLPELYAEQALIESNYDTSEAARNSRLVNEVGKATGVSSNALSARQSEIQRQYGLQVADNRINELVVAGKINSANILIDKKLDLKYSDLDAEIELYKSQLEAITPFMNKEQAQLAEKRQFLLNQAQSEIQSARDTEKQLELQKVDALKNAYDRGASAMQIAKIQDAQSAEEIASTGFLTSMEEKLKIQSLQSSLATDALQRAKIQAEMSGTTQKEYTQPQILAAGFAARTAQADAVISAIGDKFTGATSYITKYLPNIAKSADRQRFEQAQRNFVNSVLRRESGAVISDEEFANAAQQYFPQPGDTPQVVQQKAFNRKQVMTNLVESAGGAAFQTESNYLTNLGL